MRLFHFQWCLSNPFFATNNIAADDHHNYALDDYGEYDEDAPEYDELGCPWNKSKYWAIL